MSIADGEYEIDLTQLLQGPGDNGLTGDDGSFAIRYGFIPDSMDQSKPLTLYQTDKECILKARANETASSSQSIIFEGAPQRHRRSNNPALDSYYLAFPPTGSHGAVQLRRLNTTIRVSKSRNAKKWEEQCEKWDKNQDTPPSQQLHIPKIEHEKEVKPSPKPAARKPASKRPPVRPKQDSIISESDFEDIDMEPETKPKPKAKKPSALTQSKTRPLKPTRATKAPPKVDPTPIDVDEFDMGDDFKDLEEELEEVLGEDDQESSSSTPHPTASTPQPTAKDTGTSSNDTRTSVSSNPNEYEDSDNDSDNSDHDTYKFSGGPIIINYDDDSNKLSSKAYESYKSERKPMSLRDLYQNDNKHDDISSSEAE